MTDTTNLIANLNGIEKSVLREIHEPGSQDVAWGAGITLCLESLRYHSLITRSPEPQLTELGQQVVKDLKDDG